MMSRCCCVHGHRLTNENHHQSWVTEHGQGNICPVSTRLSSGFMQLMEFYEYIVYCIDILL